MGTGTKSVSGDLYDWIRPTEIREYLRANHPLNMKEKLRIIDCALCPIEKKQDMIRHLCDTETSPKERELALKMSALYGWMFCELKEDRPGQAYLLYETRLREPEEIRSLGESGACEIFHTYGEMIDGISAIYGRLTTEGCTEAEQIYHLGEVEKWIPIDGKMHEQLCLELFAMDGCICFQRIEPLIYTLHFKKQWESSGIILSSNDIHQLLDDYYHKLPLPFKSGTVVCLEPPELRRPLYGVLTVDADQFSISYVHMYYLKNYRLAEIDLGFWYFRGCSSIQWLRSASAEELSDEQSVLIDIGNYLKKNVTSTWDSAFCIMEEVALDLNNPNAAPKAMKTKPRTMDEMVAEAKASRKIII